MILNPTALMDVLDNKQVNVGSRTRSAYEDTCTTVICGLMMVPPRRTHRLMIVHRGFTFVMIMELEVKMGHLSTT